MTQQDESPSTLVGARIEASGDWRVSLNESSSR
jgi:hypothetical protein